MRELLKEPIRLKKRRPPTGDATVEDVASMLMRDLAPPPSNDAAALARVSARLEAALVRRPHRRPRAAILLIAAALALVLSVATAALRRVPSFALLQSHAREAPKTDDRMQPLPLDVPSVPAPSGDEVERAVPLSAQNGSGAHRARPESGIARTAPEPTSDGPEVAEAHWLGGALRKLRVEHDPHGALAQLDGYEVQFPARTLASEVLLARVEAHLALGNRAEALRLIEAERRPAKDSRQIVLVRGELRAGAGRCTEAVGDFDSVLAQPAADAIAERALYGRAVCYRRMQQPAAAERDFSGYLRRFPGGRFASSARAALAGP